MNYINNLGEFDSLADVWKEYPHGGKEGDYVVVNGVNVAWNKYTTNWGTDTEMPEVNDVNNEVNGDFLVKRDLRVGGEIINKDLKRIKEAIVLNKGYFKTVDDLKRSYPAATAGSKAYIGLTYPFAIYLWDATTSTWVDSGETGGEESVDLGDYYRKEESDSKFAHIIADVDDAIEKQKNEIAEFKGVVTDQVENYKPIVINGDVTNAADEEDITSKNGLLKLANRSALNGMGHIILRRNQPLTGQLAHSNAIYEIRYDFDLNDAEVTIPKGCVLDFQGGSFCNGAVVGDCTKIRSGAGAIIFKSGIKISGTWDVDTIYVAWYDLENESNQLNGVQQVLNLQNDNQYNSIIFPSYDITLTPNVERERLLEISSNTKVLVPATIFLGTNSFDGASIFYVRDKRNVEIQGNRLVGDMDTHIIPEGHSTAHEWQFGIVVNGSENVTISNFTCTKFMGDGVYLGNYGLNKNIKLININSDYNRRQGLSVERIDGLTIERCNFTNTGKYSYTAPAAGIDFEPWILDDPQNPITLKNILIKECRFYGNKGNDILVYNPNGLVENMIVDNCEFDEAALNNNGVMQAGAKGVSDFTGVIKNVMFKNCKFSYFAMSHKLPDNTEEETDYLTLDTCEIGSCVWYYNSTETEKIIIRNSTIQPKYVPFPVTEGVHPLLYVGGKSSNVSFINCIFRNRNNLCTQVMNNPSVSFYPSGLTFDSCSFYGEGFGIKDFELGIAEKIKNCYFKDISCQARIICDKDIFVEHNIFEQGDKTQRFTLSGVLHPSNTPVLTDGYYKMTIANNIFKGNEDFVYSYYQAGRADIALYFRNNDYVGIPKVKGERQYGVFEYTKVIPLNLAISQGPTENRPADNLYVGQRYYDSTIRRIIYWDGGKWIDERGKIPYKSTGPTEDRPDGENDSRYQGQMYYDTTLLKMLYWDGTGWVDERGKTPYKTIGTSDERPFGANYDIYIGMEFYDKTLNKPIWWNGKNWIDATGAEV